jgi:uncharacterized protein (DUF2236 family)
MATPRPAGVEAGQHTADDGLFGPDSVTWRVMASPSTALSAAAAASVQMLFPPVMYVIDQASHVRQNPELRAQRTGDYTATIVYGDVAAAEQAGAALRRLHATRTAVDPESGRSIRADEPELLDWVHNALTWVLLRGAATYGPSLTADERDRFVAEQRVAARLVGCDPESVAGDVATLEAYMVEMEPKLALTEPALWFRDMVFPPGLPGSPGAAVKKLLSEASAGLMGPLHRRLYGFRTNRFVAAATVAATKALLQGAASKVPVDAVIPQMREYVDTHAFGARRRRIVAVEGES